MRSYELSLFENLNSFRKGFHGNVSASQRHGYGIFVG